MTFAEPRCCVVAEPRRSALFDDYFWKHTATIARTAGQRTGCAASHFEIRLGARRIGCRYDGRPSTVGFFPDARIQWQLAQQRDPVLLRHLRAAACTKYVPVSFDTGVPLRGPKSQVSAGARATVGLDPGYRTGVKVAVVTGTGQVAATMTIYPHEPQRRWDESIAQLARLAQEHRVELIAIGNGTASRETDRLGAALIRLHPELELTKVVV